MCDFYVYSFDELTNLLKNNEDGDSCTTIDIPISTSKVTEFQQTQTGPTLCTDNTCNVK